MFLEYHSRTNSLRKSQTSSYHVLGLGLNALLIYIAPTLTITGPAATSGVMRHSWDLKAMVLHRIFGSLNLFRLGEPGFPKADCANSSVQPRTATGIQGGLSVEDLPSPFHRWRRT